MEEEEEGFLQVPEAFIAGMSSGDDLVCAPLHVEGSVTVLRGRTRSWAISRITVNQNDWINLDRGYHSGDGVIQTPYAGTSVLFDAGCCERHRKHDK